MQWGWGRRALCVAGVNIPIAPMLFALALAGCNTVAPQAGASLQGTHGATVAFDSIDGPPRAAFERLVQDINAEAQNRQLAVTSRQTASAYRVRGYLAAQSAGARSRIAWVWDVYDNDRRRVLRISGEETIPGKQHDAWAALDSTRSQQIARQSMEQLAAFLVSPAAVPAADATADAESAPALIVAAQSAD